MEQDHLPTNSKLSLSKLDESYRKDPCTEMKRTTITQYEHPNVETSSIIKKVEI